MSRPHSFLMTVLVAGLTLPAAAPAGASGGYLGALQSDPGGEPFVRKVDHRRH
jgi:hypothetical protein